MSKITQFITRPLPLNRDQRKLVSALHIAVATFAATQGIDSLSRDPFLPALTIGFMLCAAGLALLAILALRSSKDECACEAQDD